MTKYTNEEFNTLFSELKAKMKKEGIYDKCPKKAFFVFFSTFASLALSLYSVSHFPIFITIILFTTTFLHSSFIAHDLGHEQYFADKKLNKKLAPIFANLISGISSAWWGSYHNFFHHTYTNILNKDIDTETAGGGLSGNYILPMWFHNNQHVLFWPIMLMVYFELVVLSFTYVIKEKQWMELVLLIAHWAIPAYIVNVLGWGTGIAVVVSIYMLWGAWFGAVYITNHMGMEIFPEERYKDFTWFELQVITSRNVKGGRLVHWIYGGLNTQIEHHLYPRASRYNLLRAAEMTEAFCKEHDIFYHSVTPWEAYKEIYFALKDKRPKILAQSNAEEMAPSR